MELIKGKRYKFYNSVNGFTGEPHSKSKLISALFTGEYDEYNRSPLLIDKSGYKWAVPQESIFEK